MTSANVTHYYVYDKEGNPVFEGRQNCLCKNTIKTKLMSLKNPENLSLQIIWPDTEEVPHKLFDGPLTHKLNEWEYAASVFEKCQREYREMKERGTVAVLCRAKEIKGKRFVSDDGKEFTFHNVSNSGEVILSNDGPTEPWRIMDKGTFGLNYKAV